jgi:hypothetical protein
MMPTMPSGRIRIVLTLAALCLLGLLVLRLQPYSADWPGTAYTEPARHFIEAALGQDSASLARQSLAPAPVAWALDASRAHGQVLALWRHRITAWTGERRGDTAEVFVYPPGKECEEKPIVMRFVGSGDHIKVLQASSRCIGR